MATMCCCKPRFQLNTLILWLGPFVVFLLGGWIVARRMRAAVNTAAAAPLSEDERASIGNLIPPRDWRVMIWAAFGGLVLLVMAALLWPLLRTPQSSENRAAYDFMVFQDQLKEVERDLERGVLTKDEVDAARIEIQRRILAASKVSSPTLGFRSRAWLSRPCGWRSLWCCRVLLLRSICL